jgi:hypothetical protein
MSTSRPAQRSSATAVPLSTGGTVDAHRWLRTIAKATALTGGPLFLLGTVLHPARDGHGIAAVGQLYGVTHDVQAIGLLLQAISLASMIALYKHTFGRTELLAWYAALVGTLTWFALIIYHASHNTVMAQLTPEIVHTTKDLDAGGAIIVFPALLLSPSDTCCSLSRSPGVL